MTPLPRRTLVAGATGGTGRRVLARLATLGATARAFTRDARRAGGLGAAEVAQGDALSKDDCARALAGCDAVVCALGDRRPPKDRPIVDGDGVVNLAEEAARAGARRFVLVSSLGAGDTWHWLPFPMKAFFRTLGLKPILDEKSRSEARLKASALDWTILYPALLTDLPMRAAPLLVKDGRAGGTSTRQGVADAAVRCLASPNAVRASLVVVDRCMALTRRGGQELALDAPWRPW